VGDWVQAGQIIGQIDSEPYRLALSQARTARDAAQSACGRARTLHEVGSVSDQTLEQAESQLEAAQAQFESAELAVRNTTIRSPVTGNVVRRHRSAGELVSSQVPVVTISNTQDLVVSAEVPEQYVARFVQRQGIIGVRAALPAIEVDDLSARIKFVSPYVQPQTRTFRVVCEITGDTRGVLPGMYVELIFILEERRDVLVLPFDALVSGETLWYVTGEPPTAHSLRFQPEFSNDELFQVPEEHADRRFVIDGQHFLSEGLQVRVVSEGDQL
jgi:membrane fusion protein, multidrug efflux system